jgi:hypothetical protein
MKTNVLSIESASMLEHGESLHLRASHLHFDADLLGTVLHDVLQDEQSLEELLPVPCVIVQSLPDDLHDDGKVLV